MADAKSGAGAVLLKRIDDLTITKGKATGTFDVAGQPTDDGDFEFILSVTVPSMDFTKTSPTPMVATLKPDVAALALNIKGIGDMPLVGHLIQVIDPDSQEPVGDPVMTDEKGDLVAMVPDGKAFDLQIVHNDPGVEMPPHLDPAIQDGQGDRAFLFLLLTGADGTPLPGVQVSIASADGKTTHTDTTDALGIVAEVDVPVGVYNVTANGTTLKASTLFHSDFFEEGGAPYRLVFAAAAAPAAPAQQVK